MKNCPNTQAIDSYLSRQDKIDAHEEWADEVWNNFIEEKYDEWLANGFIAEGKIETDFMILEYLQTIDTSRDEDCNAFWFVLKHDETDGYKQLIWRSIENQFDREKVIEDALKEERDLQDDY